MARALLRFAPLLVPFIAFACSEATGPESDRDAPIAVARALDAQGVHRLDATFAPGEAFTLDGSPSADVGGEVELWTWTRVDTGLEVSITVPEIPGSAFYRGLAAPNGVHVFRLVVTDDSGNESPPAAVTVTIADTDAPIAVLRAVDTLGTPRPDATFAYGESFGLDGSGSTDAVGVARWIYTRLETGASIDTSAAAIDAGLLFDGGTAPIGTHVLQLVVSDGAGNESAPALLEVEVADDQPPTALLRALDAQGTPRSDATFALDESFTLDGSQSFDGEDAIATWRFTRVDTGETVDTTASAVDGGRFFAAGPAPGSYRFQLVVVDASGNESAPALLDVRLLDREAPTAVARALDASGTPVTNATFQMGDGFSLDGSQSVDAGGGRIATYRWTLLGTGASISTTAATLDASPFFDGGVAPAGTHYFQLVVSDNSGNQSQPFVLQVRVLDSEAPTASLRTLDAKGQARSVFVEGETITLDGSQSTDVAPGQIVSYSWEHVQSGVVVVSDTAWVDARVLFGGNPPVGTHDFELIVADGAGNLSQPARARLSVESL